MIETEIVESALPTLEFTDDSEENGAELVFHGRVRGLEGGEPIVALRYEHYAPMAKLVLERAARATAARFGVSDLICHHRVGDVEVGEASLRVIVRSKHRKSALEALAWFVTELKRSVPIWKWAVFSDGRVLPCGPCHGCRNTEAEGGRDERSLRETATPAR